MVLCTTYGSPQLSCSPEFVVDSLEVWGVGPERKKHDSDDEVRLLSLAVFHFTFY